MLFEDILTDFQIMSITFAKSILKFYINFHFFNGLPDFILSFLTGEFCNSFFPFFPDNKSCQGGTKFK